VRESVPHLWLSLPDDQQHSKTAKKPDCVSPSTLHFGQNEPGKFDHMVDVPSRFTGILVIPASMHAHVESRRMLGEMSTHYGASNHPFNKVPK
jgi:hypothetical protein